MSDHLPGGVLDLWDAALSAFATQPALHGTSGRTTTFAEVDAAAEALADRLRTTGLRAGGAVMVAVPRGGDWLAAVLGVWKADGVLVPVASPESGAEHAWAALTGAELRVTRTGGGTERRRFAVDRLEPTAPHPALGPRHAYTMPTSGSTGAPKPAAVTHATCTAVLRGLHGSIPFERGERAVHTASFSFSSSIRQLFLPLLGGAGVVVFGHGERFDPYRLLSVVTDARATSLDLTPSHLAAVVAVLEADSDAPRPRHLRRLLVASEPLSTALVLRWRAAVGASHTVFHLYGQTETGGAICARALPDVFGPEQGSPPLAPPFAPFRAHFAEGNGAAADRELLIEGLDPDDGILADGALDRTRYEVRLPGRPALYRTGDRFERAADGSLTFHSRIEADFKVSGVRVDGADLERHLCALTGVTAVCVAPVARAGGGTQLGVCYSSDGAAPEPETVAAATAARVGPAVPAPRVLRLPALPVNQSGKLDRAMIAAALRELPRRAERPEPLEPEDRLASLWRRHSAASARSERDFFAAGGDSLGMIALLADVAREFGVRVLPHAFHRDPTLDGLRSEMRAAATGPLAGHADATSREVETDGSLEPLRATAFQRGLWISELLDGAEDSRYWLPVDMDVAGVVEPDRLTAALRALMVRYDVLRCAFQEDGDDGLSLLPEAHDPADARLSPPQDFTSRSHLGGMTGPEPLLRLAIARREDGTTLLLRVHHAVADRPSVQAFIETLAEAYHTPDEDLAPAPSFVDWARSSTRRVEADGSAAAAFWAACLPDPDRAAGHSVILGRPVISRFEGPLPTPRATRGATRHAAWLWAFHAALARHEAPQASLIGIDVDVRPTARPDLAGPCLATLPVALAAGSPDPAAATAAVARLLPHAAVPMDAVLPPARRPVRDPRQPYFRYRLVYQDRSYPRVTFDGHTARYTRLPEGIAENTATLFVREARGRTRAELAWDSRVMDSATARRIFSATAASISSLGAAS